MTSGQTGSGKTFTMLDQKHGLYVLAARDIFSMLRTPEYQNLTAWIGFYEIYQGQLYDLLNNRKKLFAREDGKQNVVIVGLKEYVINNVNDLMQVFEYGSQARSTGNKSGIYATRDQGPDIGFVLQGAREQIRIHPDRMPSFRSFSNHSRVAKRSLASSVSLIWLVVNVVLIEEMLMPRPGMISILLQA